MVQNDKIGVLATKSYIEYEQQLNKLGTAFKDTNTIDEFVNIFTRIAPAVSDGVGETLEQINSLTDSFDTLETAITKLKDGESLNRDDILNLIEDFPELIDSLEYDVDTNAMKLPVEALKEQQNQLNKTLGIAIANRKSYYQNEITTLKATYKERGMTDEEYAEKLEEMQNQLSQLDLLGAVDISKSDVIAEALKGISKQMDNVSKHVTNIKSLASAWNEFTNDGIITSATLSQLQSDLSATEKQVSALQNAFMSGDADKVKTAIGDIAKSYISTKIAAEDLTEEQKNQIKVELEAIGVMNALDVIEQKITLNKINSKIASLDLQEATADDIDDLINLATYAGIAGEALEQREKANRSRTQGIKQLL